MAFYGRNLEWGDWAGFDMSTFVDFAAERIKHIGRRPPMGRDALAAAVPVRAVDVARLRAPPSAAVQATWLGHSTSFVQFAGGGRGGSADVSVLFDPLWSSHAPVPFGPRRLRPPPLPLHALPRVDAVCISHNHFDHLDAPTCRRVERIFAPMWCVPAGLRAWTLRHIGVADPARVVEFEWWQDLQLRQTDVSVRFVPAQHWSKRSAFDGDQSLWGGWVLEHRQQQQQQQQQQRSTRRLYYAGDTGYCRVFPEIFARCGPFDMCLLPIGPEEPRSALKFQHVGAHEAVRIHQDVRSPLSVAVHWGTFPLGIEEPDLPKRRLMEELAAARVDPATFRVIDIGETITTPLPEGAEPVEI